MLSAYHKAFLRELVDFQVKFMVVGGQARRLCAGDAGYDLDLWFEFSDENFDPVLGALTSWARDHPMHVADNFVDQFPFELRNGLQCNFPATTDVVFYADGDREEKVSSIDGVNVLIGNKSGPAFEDCLSRAVWVTIDQMNVACLSRTDDGKMPRLQTNTSRTDGTEAT